MSDSGQVPTPLLLDARETARSLGIGPRTLARLRKSGSMPCVHIGHRVLFDRRDLLDFIDRQKSSVLCPTGRADAPTA